MISHTCARKSSTSSETPHRDARYIMSSMALLENTPSLNYQDGKCKRPQDDISIMLRC